MKIDNIIHAVPGSMIIWYNHCHDSTQSSPLLFWGVCHEEGDTTPYVIPFTLDCEATHAAPFDLPEREFPETDPRHGAESCIIAMEIPGWGRIQADANSPVYGNYPAQVKGYSSDFLANSPDRGKDQADGNGVHSCHKDCQRPVCVQRRRINELESEIRATITENLHLADGDECTLKRLKDVINFQLPPESETHPA